MSDAAADSSGRSKPDACSVVWDKAQAPALVGGGDVVIT